MSTLENNGMMYFELENGFIDNSEKIEELEERIEELENNIEELKNTYICSSDNYFFENPFEEGGEAGPEDGTVENW